MTTHATAATAANAKAFLAALKSDTSEQHMQLESQELLAAIMMPGVTLKQYASYLVLMQRIEQFYENEVLPVVEHLFPNRTFLHASRQIENDLLHTGLDLNLALLQPYNAGAENITIPFALGFMYVMEGSKLGGKFIYKHIFKTLELTAEKGAGFLANTGADTGKEWMSFLQVFGHFVVTNDVASETVNGARHAFSSIYQYFQSNRLFYAA